MLYVPVLPGLPKLTKDNKPEVLSSPVFFQIPFDDVMIPTADGVKIHAWLLKAKEPSLAPTVVFFHGNAGSTFARRGHVGVMVVELEVFPCLPAPPCVLLVQTLAIGCRVPMCCTGS